MIESLHVKGFRSLADFKVQDLPNPTVMIGPNGAGKSNVFRFLEMVGQMLTPPSGGLARFVHAQGGADDQLFDGRRRTGRMEADFALRATAGRADYRFALTYANPDRLVLGLDGDAMTVQGRSRKTTASGWGSAPRANSWKRTFWTGILDSSERAGHGLGHPSRQIRDIDADVSGPRNRVRAGSMDTRTPVAYR